MDREIFESGLIDFLVDLKKKTKLLAVKADFEAEGVREKELVWLSRVVLKAGLKLAVKIGGCEAISNMESGKNFGADLIIAPMVESSFAVEKFINATKRVFEPNLKDVSFVINAETITCRKNFREILRAGRGFLDVLNVGRVDLSRSIGVKRQEIDSSEIFEYVKFFLEAAKSEGFITGFGGGLSLNSVKFIRNLAGLADRFETRKLIFAYEPDDDVLKFCLTKADEFELLCLKYKSQTYGKMADEDGNRVKMILQRLEEF